MGPLQSVETALVFGLSLWPCMQLDQPETLNLDGEAGIGMPRIRLFAFPLGENLGDSFRAGWAESSIQAVGLQIDSKPKIAEIADRSEMLALRTFETRTGGYLR